MTKPRHLHENQLLDGIGAAVFGGTILYAISLMTTGWWEVWPAYARGLILLGLVAVALTLCISGLRKRTWTVIIGLKVSRATYRWSYLRQVAERSVESLGRKKPKFVEQGVRQAEASVAAKRSEYFSEGQLAARAELDAQRESLIEQGRLDVHQAVAAERKAARVPIWRAARARVGGYASHDNYLILWQDGEEVATDVMVESTDTGRLAVCESVPARSVVVAEDLWKRGHGRAVAVEIRPEGLRFGVHLQVSWLNLNGDRQHQSVFVAPEHLRPLPDDA